MSAMFYYRFILFFFFGLSLALIFTQFFLETNLVWLSHYFLAQAGFSTGISATVPPNPVNVLAQQLKEKEVELSRKEKTIAEKEVLMEKQILEKLKEQQKKDKKSVILYLALTNLGITALISVNFYLDRKRNKKLA